VLQFSLLVEQSISILVLSQDKTTKGRSQDFPTKPRRKAGHFIG
jgi:hypothetical protein